MATSRVTTWTELTNPAGTEVLAVDDLTTNRKITVGNLRTGVPNATIVVSFAGTETVYKCNGDGSTDDRAQILAALTLAIANMPAKVELGAGDYAMSNGIELDLPDSSQGLTIKGQGANTTTLRWHNATVTDYYALKIFSDNAKTYKTANAGAENVSIYPRDIIVEDIGFLDDDPFAHQTRGTDFLGTADSGSTTTMTDTGAFTSTLFNRSGGPSTTTFYIANTTTGAIGRIVSNTADTVTFDELVAGSSNTFSASDGYQISCVDANNGTYGNQVEETHAVTIQYCRNAHIRNCTADAIGDEAFNFSFVKQGSMSNLTCRHVPSMSFSGGAITVQHGCEDISVTDNLLDAGETYGSVSAFVGCQGINLEAIDLAPIKNITINGNKIRGMGASGINMNSSFTGTSITQIAILSNTVENCGLGLARQGGESTSEVTVVGNVFKGITDYGIDVNGTPADSSQWIVSDNTLDTCTAGGMQLNMVNTLLSNNIFKDCGRGIFIFNGVDINIASGVFIGCGGSLQEEIEDTSATSTTRVANIIIEDSNASSSHVKGVHSLANSTIKNSNQTTQRQTGIYDVNHVSGCDIDVGITQIAGTGIRGSVCNNTIDYFDGGGAGTGAAINLNSSNDEWLISGNRIDVSTSTNNQECLIIPSGAVDTLVVGNHFKSKTAGVANSVSDSGSGTKADFTNNNFTS